MGSENTRDVVAIYAGSFDPITNGHLEIIKSSAKMFDKVIVLIAKNPAKKDFIPVTDRVELIEAAVRDEGLTNVIVDCAPSGLLTVEYAREKNAHVLVRGIRGFGDVDSEMQLAAINHKLNDNVQTVFLPADSTYAAISSSVIREIVSCKGDVAQFVPNAVVTYLNKMI